MNSKSIFSATGLVSIAVFLLFSVLVISLLPSVRIDLTEDKLYSLSDGTRNIVSDLNTPIELILFYSDEATGDVPQLRSYATRVQELLQEIVLASNGNVSLRQIDPEPFSEDEDLATTFGIQAVPITQGGEEVYFGLVAVENPTMTVPNVGAGIRDHSSDSTRPGGISGVRVHEADHPGRESGSSGGGPDY